MPTRGPAANGTPCWNDLMTSDTAKSRDFYCRLFGWEAEDPNPDFGGYFNFTKDGARVAGCMAKMPDNPMPDVWSVYLATDDAAKTLELVAADGGQVIAGAMPVGDLGIMGVTIDPAGAAIGLWQPDTFPGLTTYGEAGTPSWFELHTRDHAAAVDFYRNAFRAETQTVSDTDEFRYTVLTDGETWWAGIMDARNFLPEGVPSHWSVYFGADDTDATLARAVELGATVVDAPQDTPYGRLASATDPTGALFKLVAPN